MRIASETLAKRTADLLQHFALPRLGPLLALQRRPRLAPREGEQHEAQRIVREAADLDAERIEDGLGRDVGFIGHDAGS